MITGRWARVVGVLVLAVCSSAQLVTAHPQGDEAPAVEKIGDAEIARTSSITEVAPGTTVRIDNPYGNIRFRFGGYEPKVEVQAVIQRLHAERPFLDVASEEQEGVLAIAVGYPDGFAAPERAERDDRADLVVFVPIDVNVDAETTRDLIEASGLKSALTARTGSGPVTVRESTGPVVATTTTGTVLFALEDEGDEPYLADSDQGDVTVSIPANASATLSIGTAERICTDVSIEIDRDDQRVPPLEATAVLGKGTRPIRVVSRAGEVTLDIVPTFKRRATRRGD